MSKDLTHKDLIDSRKVLFLHMPKCAGTSMRLVLRKAYETGHMKFKSLIYDYDLDLTMFKEKVDTVKYLNI